MAFNIPFKYRVQIVKFAEGNKIVRDRFCFMREQDAKSSFDRMKSTVAEGEVLFLDYREKARCCFKEVKRYART